MRAHHIKYGLQSFISLVKTRVVVPYIRELFRSVFIKYWWVNDFNGRCSLILFHVLHFTLHLLLVAAVGVLKKSPFCFITPRLTALLKDLIKLPCCEICLVRCSISEQ